MKNQPSWLWFRVHCCTEHTPDLPAVRADLIAGIGLVMILMFLLFFQAAALSAPTTAGGSLAINVLLSNTLREKRQRILENDHNPIVLKAKTENRGFTAEERVKLDAIDKDLDELDADIGRAEKAEKRELEAGVRVATPEQQRALETAQVNPLASDEYRSAFTNFVRYGGAELTPEERNILQHGYRNDPRQSEKRAQTTTTTGGGYTIPTGFVNQLEMSMKQFGGMRQPGVATILNTDSGNDLPFPTVDDTAQVGALLSENTQVSAQDVTFGQIVFKAYKYSSKLVLVPIELLQDSAFSFDTILGRIFGERLGRITNTHFTTGDNASKPQGYVTAAGTVAAANAGSIVAADLIDLFHGVDPAYRQGPNVRFMLNDSTLKAVRKLVDNSGGAGVGNFLWMAGLQAGIPDTILGKPYTINQDMASIATGQKTVGFGDFSKYYIRNITDVTVLRLTERYADYHQVGFLAFMRQDGRTLDAGTDPIKVLLHP